MESNSTVTITTAIDPPSMTKMRRSPKIQPQTRAFARLSVTAVGMVVVVALLFPLQEFSAVHAWTPPRLMVDPLSRRVLLSRTVEGMLLTPVVLLPAIAAATADSLSSSLLLEELKASEIKLQPIPDLLAQQEWDKVRSILKVPPVNKLWNLGDVSAVPYDRLYCIILYCLCSCIVFVFVFDGLFSCCLSMLL